MTSATCATVMCHVWVPLSRQGTLPKQHLKETEDLSRFEVNLDKLPQFIHRWCIHASLRYYVLILLTYRHEIAKRGRSRCQSCIVRGQYGYVWGSLNLDSRSLPLLLGSSVCMGTISSRDEHNGQSNRLLNDFAVLTTLNSATESAECQCRANERSDKDQIARQNSKSQCTVPHGTESRPNSIRRVVRTRV